MADTVTRRGASFTLRDCNVQRIAHGKVHYISPTGQPRSEPYQDIASIGFDGLPALDEAEKHLRANELTDARDDLLKAYVQADNNTQRVWLHSRLALVHDLRGEYVAAARHFAGVLALDPHLAWMDLAPISEPAEATVPLMREALHALQRAGETVDKQRLKTVINEMIQNIEPMHGQKNAAYDGPSFESGETVSGIPVSDIRENKRTSTADAQPDRPRKSDRSRADDRTPPSNEADNPGAHIDSLLERGRFSDALAQCESLARNTAGYSLARLLYQYGRSLHGVGRPRDASVQFTRCAIHFPNSRFAALSWLAAAKIHVNVFDDKPTARRLLEKAHEISREHGYDEIINTVRDAQNALPDR